MEKLSEPYLGIDINVYLFDKVYLHLGSPNWRHDDEHKPRWFPKWEYFYWNNINCPTHLPHHFMVDWFFHFSIMW